MSNKKKRIYRYYIESEKPFKPFNNPKEYEQFCEQNKIILYLPIDVAEKLQSSFPELNADIIGKSEDLKNEYDKLWEKMLESIEKEREIGYFEKNKRNADK